MGLSTAVDTVVAPAEAFERLRSAPSWGWALLITLVLMLAGTYLQGPAARHAAAAQTQRMMNTSSLFAGLSADQKEQAVAKAGRTTPFSYLGPVVVLFAVVFFNTLFMLIGNAVGRGEGTFKQLWSGSMNIALPTLGVGALVLGVIAMIRGADSFNDTLDMMRAAPSLASLVPQAPAVTAAFLASISVFSIWGLFLNATMLRVTAKTSTGVAYAFATLVLLLGALAGASGVAIAHGFGLA